MCELFAMSSKFSTDINLSLQEFALHGGGTGPHGDGWGIAYSRGRDFRIIKEPEAAFDSDCVRYIQNHRFRSQIVISHVRQASRSIRVAFENTHPFDRELFGRRFVFAHNGFVQGFESLGRSGEGPFRPMGGTDSEKVFCHLLDAIAARIQSEGRYHFRLTEGVLQELSPHIRALGTFNFLLSDSEYLFAHGDTSLYSICRSCHLEEVVLESEELRIMMSRGPNQETALVSTVPLTGSEHWRSFQPGEVRIFYQGRQL